MSGWFLCFKIRKCVSKQHLIYLLYVLCLDGNLLCFKMYKYIAGLYCYLTQYTLSLQSIFCAVTRYRMCVTWEGVIKSSRSVNCNTPLKWDAILAAVKCLLFILVSWKGLIGFDLLSFNYSCLLNIIIVYNIVYYNILDLTNLRY